MKLQNFRKLGENAKHSKKRTLPIRGQNLFRQWCPLIKDYSVVKKSSKNDSFLNLITLLKNVATKNFIFVPNHFSWVGLYTNPDQCMFDFLETSLYVFNIWFITGIKQ